MFGKIKLDDDTAVHRNNFVINAIRLIVGVGIRMISLTILKKEVKQDILILEVKL